MRHFDVEYLPASVKFDAYTNPTRLSRTYYSLFLNAHNTEKWQGLTQYLINDSSPLTSAFYHPETENLAYNIFSLWDNINVVLRPIPLKSTNGRVHSTDKECIAIFERIIQVMDKFNIKYVVQDFDTTAVLSQILTHQHA